MFAELCTTGRTIELERIHRFTNDWEAAASLQLRHGDPRALDAYEAHGRIIPGTLAEHLDTIADMWIDRHAAGETVAITTTTNDHVDPINQLIHQHRLERGDLDPTRTAVIADGDRRVRRRRRRHPPQPPPAAHHHRRHRPQPRTVDRHRTSTTPAS